MPYPAAMKVLKITLFAIGAIVLIVASWLLFMTVMVDIKVLWEIATRYSTSTGLKDPRPTSLMIAGLAAVGGLFIGVGLGLPMRLGPSDEKLDELVEARLRERLAIQGPSTPDPNPDVPPPLA